MAETIRRGMLFGGAATGIFVFGIVMAVLGTLFGLPEMRARLSIDLAQQGNLFLLLYVGILLATLVAGPVIDSLGNKVILVASSVLVAAGMAGLAYAHSFGGAAIPAVLLGLGGGGLNTSTNVLISDLYGEKRGPMLNILGIFYGIGALCMPLLAAVIAGHFAIAPQLLFCAGLAGACALLFLAMHFPPASAPQSFSWREALQVARYPGVLVLGFLLFCQSGNEASIGGWTSTYVGAAGLGARTATLILAGYWAALMAGRLAVSGLLKFVGKRQLVLSSRCGCADWRSNSLDEPLASDAGGGRLGNRVVVRGCVSNGARDCRRFLPEDGGDGVWVVVRHRACRRNVVSVGRGADFAAIRGAIWNGGAAGRCNGNLHSGMENIAGRKSNREFLGM